MGQEQALKHLMVRDNGDACNSSTGLIPFPLFPPMLRTVLLVADMLAVLALKVRFFLMALPSVVMTQDLLSIMTAQSLPWPRLSRRLVLAVCMS